MKDELNAIRSIPYDEYFGAMDLTEAQKKRYIKTAEDIEEVMKDFFSLVENNGIEDVEKLQNELQTMFLSFLIASVVLDDYLLNYSKTFSEAIVDSTVRHFGDGWYLSDDRAKFVAEDQSATVMGYAEYRKAVEEGYTTKTWHTFIDKRTRKTHRELNGKKISIYQLFDVGKAKMRFPKDYEFADGFPEEIINCRCTVKYGDKGKKIQYELTNTRNGEREGDENAKDKITIDPVKYRVDFDYVKSDMFYEKLRSLGESEEVTQRLYEEIKKILDHRQGTNGEDLLFANPQTNEFIVNDKGVLPSACEPNAEQLELLAKSPKYSIIALHNHPGSTGPSPKDMILAGHRMYKYGLVVGHNGDLYKYTVLSELTKFEVSSITPILERFPSAAYNRHKLQNAVNDLREYHVILEVL